MNGQYYLGEIYYIAPRDSVGCEQFGGRPGIIVSNDMNNEYSSTVEVVLLTTRDKKPLPTHVKIESAKYPSTALCEQIDTVDKRRICNYVGSISTEEQKAVDEALQISLMLEMGKPGDDILRDWRESVRQYESDVKEPEFDGASEPEAEADTPKPVTVDVTASPEYIKICAELNVYKEPYQNLLGIIKSV